MKTYHYQQGLAAIEFLITAPVVLLLLTGITEIGSAFISYNSLNKQVQNAARYAVTEIYGTSSSDRIADIDEIKNIVVYGSALAGGSPILNSLTTSDVSVTHENKYVTVSATYNYVPLLNLIPTDINFNFPLSASAVMRTAL